MYWADHGLKNSNLINNVANNSVGISQIGRAITELKKPTLYELFGMQPEGRGLLFASQDEAETAFGLHEEQVKAFDTDLILRNPRITVLRIGIDTQSFRFSSVSVYKKSPETANCLRAIERFRQ